jgi:hypothetical protein
MEMMRWLRSRCDVLIALLLEVRRIRHAAAYSIPIIAVIAITFLRLLSGGELVARLPFTTYFPAIVVTALLAASTGCGRDAGVDDRLVSDDSGWVRPGSRTLLLLLVLVTAANIVVVALLSAAIELIINRGSERETAE